MGIDYLDQGQFAEAVAEFQAATQGLFTNTAVIASGLDDPDPANNTVEMMLPGHGRARYISLSSMISSLVLLVSVNTSRMRS